jgi:hypothetical protein
MGLDLIVEGRAKPGHEPEWRDILERSFADEMVSESEKSRFLEISIPAVESIDAPRPGFDPAEGWAVAARNARSPADTLAAIGQFRDHVVQVANSEGVPKYSNGLLYEGVDETSFRGQWLKQCRDVLGKQLLGEAWNSKFPEDAISYGQALLAAADAAETAGLVPQPRRTVFSRLGLIRAREPMPLSKQLDIVRDAGRWFLFWGRRGHPIRAWV